MYVIKNPATGSPTHNVTLEMGDFITGGAFFMDPFVNFGSANAKLAGCFYFAGDTHDTIGNHLLSIIAKWTVAGYAGVAIVRPHIYLTTAFPSWTNTANKGKMPPDAFSIVDPGATPFNTTNINFQSAFNRNSDGNLYTRYHFFGATDNAMNCGQWVAIGFSNSSAFVAAGTTITLNWIEIVQNLGK
jgi:hypothetical protein